MDHFVYLKKLKGIFNRNLNKSIETLRKLNGNLKKTKGILIRKSRNSQWKFNEINWIIPGKTRPFISGIGDNLKWNLYQITRIGLWIVWIKYLIRIIWFPFISRNIVFLVNPNYSDQIIQELEFHFGPNYSENWVLFWSNLFRNLVKFNKGTCFFISFYFSLVPFIWSNYFFIFQVSSVPFIFQVSFGPSFLSFSLILLFQFNKIPQFVQISLSNEQLTACVKVQIEIEKQ